jgi:hypothetical protein
MYKLETTTSDLGVVRSSIRRLGDMASIPFDPANTDYQKYLQWLYEGNEPLPPDEVTE